MAGVPLQYVRQGFNPRPPSLTGERRMVGLAEQGKACFNPRPPSLTGELLGTLPAWQRYAVSIHARHR